MLDRCLVSTKWMEHHPLVVLMPLPKITSDHFPIKLDFDKQPSLKKPFRFELFWTLDKLSKLKGDRFAILDVQCKKNEFMFGTGKLNPFYL